MSESVIGSLRAILGIDTVAFSQGLKGAESALNQFSKTFLGVAKGLSVIGIGVAFVSSIRKAIDAAEEMQKASEKFGVPTEALSRLKYAAELSEVSFESLGKGLKKFGFSIQDALKNPVGSAAKSLAALGLTIDDLKTKDTEQLFLKAADGTAKLADGMGKAATVGGVFGKKFGADLIPLLNKGSAGIKESGEEAEKLGLIVGGYTAIQAEKFNDTMRTLGERTPGIFNQVLATALPAMTQIAIQFKTASLEGGFLGFAVKELTGFIKEAIFEWNRWAYIIQQVGIMWEALQLQLKEKKTFEDVVESNRRIAEAMKNVWNSGEIIRKQTVWQEFSLSLDMIVTIAEKAGKSFTALPPPIDKASDAVSKFIEATKKSQAIQKIDIDTAFAAIGVKEKLKLLAEADAEAIKRKFPLSAQEKADVDALANSAANYAVQLAGVNTIKDNLTPMEAYEQKLKDINQQLQEGAIKAPTFARAQAKAFKDIQDQVLTAAASAAAGFSALFTQLGAKNKQLFEVGKAFAIAEATINTYKAANQALTAPPGPPVSYVYVAAAIAAGIANVVKIASTQYTGAALGGSFKVPGGQRATDSKLIRMHLAPGERVDVTPANQVNRAGGQLTLSPIRPKDFFTGDTVREMVFAIDEWMRNGGTGVRFAKQ